MTALIKFPASLFGIMTLCLSFFQSCVVFAPLPPMVTYGGPETTAKGSTEAALAVGSGGALFPGAHAGGQGWFGRFRYGVDDKLDLGIDAMSILHSDKQTFTTNIGARYALLPRLRLEGSIGGADDSQGKSLNGQLALTTGTLRPDHTWNYYASARIGYAQGYPGNVYFGIGPRGSVADSIAPPNTWAILINGGAQASVNDKMTFIFEGGYGYIFPNTQKTGTALYLSCGLLFHFRQIVSIKK